MMSDQQLEKLAEIEQGVRLVEPVSYEHAVRMLMVAYSYIQESHATTWAALTKDYSK